MAAQENPVTEWDEHGVAVSPVSEWDEHGKPIANIASEKEMSTHPPSAPQVDMQEMDSPGTRLQAMNRPLPRPAGGGEEATLAEGAGPGAAALTAIGTAGMPIEAMATRSLKPLVPLLTGYLGSQAGRYVGHDIGSRLGEPEAGETIGEIGGGIAGAAGVKIPHGPEGLLKDWLKRALLGAEEQAPRLQRVQAPVTAAEEPFRLTSPNAGTEPAIQERLQFPEQGPPAAPERLKPVTGAETPTRSRIAPETAPQGQVPPNGRLEPIGKRIGNIVDQATSSKPLEKNVPIREQVTPAARKGQLDTANQRLAHVFDQATETKGGAASDPIKAKYPDPAVRQMVRANGEQMYEAAKGNPETLKAIHDLTRVELRQALINAGEDMGQQTVSNSKFAGEGGLPREEAFKRLLQKGHTPEDIVRLAKHTEPEIELIEHNGPRGNGSGEAGGGGLEEQSRHSSENAQGVKYFREMPGGGRQPLTGLGRQDLRAGAGQKIIRVEANGHETVLDAQPARPGALRPIRRTPR